MKFSYKNTSMIPYAVIGVLFIIVIIPIPQKQIVSFNGIPIIYLYVVAVLLYSGCILYGVAKDRKKKHQKFF